MKQFKIIQLGKILNSVPLSDAVFHLRRNQAIYAHNIYLGVRLTQKYL